MFPHSSLKTAGLVFSILLVAIVAACGGDFETYTGEENTVPGHLLPRTAFLVEHPISISEATSRNMEPYVIAPLAMEPGQTFQFVVGVFDCCIFTRPVQADVSWTIDPREGATIDAATGVFTVNPATAHGSVFIVGANIENGAHTPSTEITVFTRDMNPFIGSWREDDAGSIGELLFTADGQYTVTWTMLEDYMDLFGTYEFVTATGEIEFNFEWDRIKTAGFSGAGSFRFEEGNLILEGICTGGPDSKLGTGDKVCFHRFVPRS